ncbi:MAG: hypothetical protein DRJ40_10450 [Thermoprotei archaeon]|nr:MAG: hypothetical protein DRJ40_10450 [Thermoprotei archaeon]
MLSRGRSLAQALENILMMTVGEFIERYRDLLPRFTMISETETLEKVLEHIYNGYHYIVVTDHRGRVRGVVYHLDLIYSIGHPHFEQIPALLNILHFRRRIKVPIDVLLKTPVDEIMRRTPPCIKEDKLVSDSVDLMHKVHRSYVIVMSKSDEVRGIVTAHSILRAALRESGSPIDVRTHAHHSAELSPT